MDIKDSSKWFKFLKTATYQEISNSLSKGHKKRLLNLVQQDTQQSCLHFAVTLSKLFRGTKLLEVLISHGAKVDHLDSLQQTPLFYAAKLGHKQQVLGLLKHKANPNAKDLHGQTPLFYASKEGHTSVIKTLLNKGANIDAANNLGQTALFSVCMEGDLDSAKVLISHGSDPNHADKSGNTPIFWAKRSRNKDLVELLESAGAVDIPAKRKRPEIPRKTEKKVACQLMRVDRNGTKTPITVFEFKEFEENFPEISKFFTDPDQLAELDSLSQENLESLRPWEKQAKKLLRVLWRHEKAWIFYEPVDPVKLKILDYFDIIKEPMDFGTIKRKLMNNAYADGEDFVEDLELVFRNCRTYNPPGSDVIKMCNSVEELYESELEDLDLLKYR